MEAIGLVTWRPWLRLVAAVGVWGSRGGHFAKGCHRELQAACQQTEAVPFRPVQLGT
jgi:hypothetical protein